MNKGLLHLHSGLRYVILALLVIVLAMVFTKNKKAKELSLPLLISSHIMLLIGIYQWFWGNFGWLKVVLPEGVTVMKDKLYRFFMVEHPIMMILAILCITIAHRNVKAENWGKARNFLVISLLLILAAVPWHFRDIVGRAWMPS